MDVLIAVLFSLFCLFNATKMLKSDAEIEDYYMGVVSIFSFAYCAYPVFVKDWIYLSSFSSDEIFDSVWLNFLYLIAIFVGLNFFKILKIKANPIKFEAIDHLFDKYVIETFFLAFAIYLVYFFTNDLTSYSAESFEDFFHERSKFASILSMMASYAMALMAMQIARSFKDTSLANKNLLIVPFLFMTCLLLTGGQRLLLLTPLMMLFVAFVTLDLNKIATKMLAISIVVLLVVSPFAVYLREANSEGQRGKAGAVDSAKDFNFGKETNPFVSIAERSDLLQSNIYLKRYIDYNGYADFEYYKSIIAAPIPKFIYGNKPYPLSTDGTLWTELSVLSWRIQLGETTGSLTAFGAIAAYRLGGWFAVVIDGLLLGMLSYYLAHKFGRGGLTARLFYLTIFVISAVKKAPASFTELLVEFLPIIPIVIFLYIINNLYLLRDDSKI